MADRYLLESGAPDGYLLEDASGVLLIEGAGGTTHTGAVSISAAGTLAAVAAVAYSAVVAISAAATTLATGVVTLAAVCSISAGATVSAVGSTGATHEAAASLSGSATVSPSAVLGLSAVSAVGATAGVSANGVVTYGAQAALTAAATVGATGRLDAVGAASILGAATVSAAGTLSAPPSPSRFFGDDDIEIMLAEVGEDITVGGVAGKAVFDETDEELLRGEMAHLLGKSIALTFRTHTFPSLQVGTAVVRVGPPAVNFTVFERIQIGDGALTKALLARA